MATDQQQRENVPSQPPRDGGEKPKQQQQQPQGDAASIDPARPKAPDKPRPVDPPLH